MFKFFNLNFLKTQNFQPQTLHRKWGPGKVTSLKPNDGIYHRHHRHHRFTYHRHHRFTYTIVHLGRWLCKTMYDVKRWCMMSNDGHHRHHLHHHRLAHHRHNVKRW